MPQDDVQWHHEEVRKALGERGKTMTLDELRVEELMVHATRLGVGVGENNGLHDDPDDVELIRVAEARLEEGDVADPGLTAWINEHVVVWTKDE
jgi:hypothetical protein